MRHRERELDAKTREFEATQKTRRVELQLQLELARNSKEKKKRGVDDVSSSSADESPNTADRDDNAMVRVVPQKITIYLVTTEDPGRLFVLKVDPTSTVGQCKASFEKKTLVSTRHQRWYANAGYLDDRETLQHYGIVEFDKIDAICEQTGC